MTEQKTCLVVQGLGQKIDFATGRSLNLDASYAVIKEAIEEAGLVCVRIDEVMNGFLDSTPYEWLFRADLVVVDLSTSNLTAAYELGIRHGLRPEATIVVAESQFRNPFDVMIEPVHRYEHLGSDLGRREAERFKSELRSAIQAALEGQGARSPVYEFTQLDAPAVTSDATSTLRMPPGFAASPEAALDQRVRPLVEGARHLMQQNDFVAARTLLERARLVRPDDVRIVQQLALATYKSKTPDPITALKDAQALLRPLGPETTNDSETLGLWGAVHKRLWDATHDLAHLDQAIASYDRAFVLAENDYYNGINLAFLLDVRASLSTAPDDGEAIADAVVARRIRRSVIAIGEKLIEAGPTSGRYATTAAKAVDAVPESGTTPAEDERYWLIATLLEASIGIGDEAAAARWRAVLEAESPAAWIASSAQSQLDALVALLAKSPLPPARADAAPPR